MMHHTGADQLPNLRCMDSGDEQSAVEKNVDMIFFRELRSS